MYKVIQHKKKTGKLTFPGTVSIIKKSLPRVRGAFSKGNAMKKKTRIGILAAALVLLVAAGVFVG